MMVAMETVGGTVGEMDGREGSRIVGLDVAGTAVFAASAAVSALFFTNPVRIAAVAVALALFACGVFAFLSGYWTAVQRSRTDQVSVTQLYFLTGEVAPRSVKRSMLGLLAVQVVVALVTAITRSSTDGRPGSTLAFGILVPMFGLGLNGLWGARNGRFLPRHHDEPEDSLPEALSESSPHGASVPPSHDEMEQNSTHG